MNWFTKKRPESALQHRLNNQDVEAAREVLHKFMKNAPTDPGRVFQALTVLVTDLDRKANA